MQLSYYFILFRIAVVLTLNTQSDRCPWGVVVLVVLYVSLKTDQNRKNICVRETSIFLAARGGSLKLGILVEGRMMMYST